MMEIPIAEDTPAMTALPCTGFSVGRSGLRSYGGKILLDQQFICFVSQWNPIAPGLMTTLGGLGMLLGATGNLWTMIIGPIAGFLIGMTLSGLYWIWVVYQPRYPFEYPIGKVPVAIRKRLRPYFAPFTSSIFIVPREVVTEINCSAWTGLTIRIGQYKYSSAVSVGQSGKVRRILVRNGWLTDLDEFGLSKER